MLRPVQQFKDFIKSHTLFQPQDKILLAVSGGKDSVTMVQLFVASGFSFGIAHCNFNLRGAESIRDQEFVKNLAQQLNVPFHLNTFDTTTYAKKNKISIQMAARALRYTYFEELRLAFNYQKIAVAQHHNDVMETMILNLIRGTGIAGLHGIRPDFNYIIRPMLCFNSASIEEMVEENSFDYVEDSSNSSTKYMRNKIRLHIIPEMKKLNPSLEDTFRKNLSYFSELEELLIEQVSKIKKDIFLEKDHNILINIEAVQNLYPKQLLLFELLKPFNFNLTTVKDIISNLNGIAGKLFFSDTHQLIIDRKQLIISSNEQHILRTKLIEVHENQISFGDFQLAISITESIPKDLHTELNKIYVPTELLIFPLKLRAWQQTDSFRPFGMSGEKKISDYFINQKIPVNHKKNIPILINGDGKIIWICGYRSDDRFKVKSNTKKITIFELKK